MPNPCQNVLKALVKQTTSRPLKVTTLGLLLRAGNKLDGATDKLEDITPPVESSTGHSELQNDLHQLRLKLAALIQRERSNSEAKL